MTVGCKVGRPWSQLPCVWTQLPRELDHLSLGREGLGPGGFVHLLRELLLAGLGRKDLEPGRRRAR